jgi:putative ABC transport system substrate-binding protein
LDFMTTRRRFLGALAAGLAAPQLARAQAQAQAQTPKMPTVAVLFAGDSDEDEPALRPFFEEMARFGWVEGKNIVYDRHSGKGTREYLATMASLAAGREPDLIYATTASLAKAVLAETGSLPVVFATTADPVSAGLVDSFAKPGRNATGTYQAPGDADLRRFQLVREALPRIRRMGAVFDRAAQEYGSLRAAHEKAAHGVGLELVSAEFTNFEAIARIFSQFKRQGLIAAEVTPSYQLLGRRREVASLAALNGIALIGHRIEWAEAGAVMSYGVDVSASHRRAASFADRILKGAKAADIAIERVQTFELAINTRAADALGLHFAKPLLQRANRVIA